MALYAQKVLQFLRQQEVRNTEGKTKASQIERPFGECEPAQQSVDGARNLFVIGALHFVNGSDLAFERLLGRLIFAAVASEAHNFLARQTW